MGGPVSPFDLDGPALTEPRRFVVTPAAGGGLDVCAVALGRLFIRAMDEGLWWATIDLAEPHPNPGFAHLGPDEDGSLYTEVAGDYYLPVSARLDVNDPENDSLTIDWLLAEETGPASGRAIDNPGRGQTCRTQQTIPNPAKSAVP